MEVRDASSFESGSLWSFALVLWDILCLNTARPCHWLVLVVHLRYSQVKTEFANPLIGLQRSINLH